MTLWRSPLLFPMVDGQDGRKSGFLDQQVTSITWILQRFFGELPRLKIMDPDSEEPIAEKNSEKVARQRLRGPRYFGGIFADSMGLGKTLSCIACLELMAARGLNVIRGKTPEGKQTRARYRPMLILAPNATVASQWVEDICQNTDAETIPLILTSGNGLNFQDHPSGRVRSLSPEQFGGEWPRNLKYIWDDKQKRAAKSIIIMPIDTFASRTVKRPEG